MIRQTLLATLALAFSATALADDYSVPRNSFDQPDLGGVWTNATITTLERPDNFEDLVVTEDEARQFEAVTNGFFDSIDDLPEGDIEAGNDVGGYNSFWLDPGTQMMQVDGEYRSSLLVYPEDGKLPMRMGTRAKLLSVASQINGANGGFDGPELRPLGERCIVGFGSTGGPPMLPVVYNNHYQIVQSPEHVMIMVEMNHDARIVRLDSEHQPKSVQPWMGDSIGSWDGDTLVVKTTNFHPGQTFRFGIKAQIFISPDAMVTERFTRVAEDALLYEFEVDDPAGYTDVWRAETTLRAAEGPIYEYACHEGNYAMPGILAGARREESLAAGENPAAGGGS